MQCTEGTEIVEHRVLCANHTSRFSPRTSYSQQEDLLWDGSHMMEPGQRSYSSTPRSTQTKEASAGQGRYRVCFSTVAKYGSGTGCGGRDGFPALLEFMFQLPGSTANALLEGSANAEGTLMRGSGRLPGGEGLGINLTGELGVA